MPKMRRFADLLRIGNCSFGGPSNAVTNVLELLGGHHLTGCMVAVGDDCVRVKECLGQKGVDFSLSFPKRICMCPSSSESVHACTHRATVQRAKERARARARARERARERERERERESKREQERGKEGGRKGHGEERDRGREVEREIE